MLSKHKQNTLMAMLVWLTILLVATQAIFFFIHYKVGNIVDSLAAASITKQLLHLVVLLPLCGFLLIQLLAYGLFIGWVWFVAVSLGELCKLTNRAVYQIGLLFWLAGVVAIFSLNAHYFPNSYFAGPIHQYVWLNRILLSVCSMMLVMASLLAYVNCFLFKRHRMIGSLFILIVLAAGGGGFHERLTATHQSKPNIIFIGLDSLRPDYTGYFGNTHVHTPNIDHFLQSSTVYTNAYTPLARTFPSWVGILTAQYPLHNHARMNLADPKDIILGDTLAKRLKASGYFTIYGTDEVRFTDITKAYGFDRIIGPKGGAVEFLLGGLSDFPLTNLLINLPISRFVFPYNYADRAADITYEPDSFLRLVKAALANRPNQPVFLAIHLCLTHWPFTWAHDGQPDGMTMPDRYASSVEAVDAQLGSLLQILKQAGLLDHSMVVLLSDHGVTLGMKGDRIITEKQYRGDPKQMKSVSKSKLTSAPEFTLDFKRDYSISASYGQGTDVLSLKQNHVILAFQEFGAVVPAKHVNEFSSLLDIAPTVLDYLHLAPMEHIDGMSFAKLRPRTFFIETGDKVAETESNKIHIEKVIQRTAAAYRIDPNSGLLVLVPVAEKSIIENKQRAILWRDWLLARYPAETRYIIEPIAGVRNKKQLFTPKRVPPYMVLVNLKTGFWTVDMSSPFAKKAPIAELTRQFKAFYGNEV